MRRTKIAVAIILLAAVFLGVTGCANAKKLTRQDFISELESYGIPKTDQFNDIAAALSRNGGDNGYYIALDKEEAGKLSNSVLNRFNTKDEIKADDFVIAFVMEKGSKDKFSSSFVCYLTFDDSTKAEKAYKELVEMRGDEENGKTGTQSGISYCVSSAASAAGKNKIGTGIYLQGNTVIFLRAQAASEDDYKFADTICGKFGLVSPSKAK